MNNDNPNDDCDFAAEMFSMEGVKPLKQDKHVYHGQTEADRLTKQLRREALERTLGGFRNYLTTEPVPAVLPDDIISFKKDGVQEGVFKNLRLGKYDIHKTLSLQGMNFKQVHDAFFQFIVNNYQEGNRSLLIKHGMGIHSKPFPAFYKSYVNVWLHSMPEILAFHTATKQHGGYGAVYVLLKKNEKQKMENRELHKAG